MAEAREPMADETYNRMTGLLGKIDYDVLLYTPFTGWSQQNTHFDGIKYCGPISMNPFNPLNMDDDTIWQKETLT